MILTAIKKMAQKMLLVKLFILPFVICTAQPMDYISNLRNLLALDPAQIQQFKRTSGDLKFIHTSDNGLLVTNMPLLPAPINHDLLPPASLHLLLQDDLTLYGAIVRLIQEDISTIRLDFYGRALDFHPNYEEDSLAVTRIKDDLRKCFKEFHWAEQPISNHFALSFSYQELQLTILLETLADVQHYPFWNKLNADFHYQYTADHIPVLERFPHFIIRKTTSL
ncbi:hypothetical protein [Paraflavitalea sp. CAU 1676]|uniref:hypothetical protein n=1 Tax=Paraflavitalea sp. CAU 1676 TaxID=3032598 RepID=UPI0023DC1949|nr:hypothetical protein [Paraflavitalea sp. CAU 1676]MDF2188982.1 hypothetical protein [Paraflavitalea sp. CAU 1676]